MKEEPNSTSFQALTKAALDKAEPEDHVKKVFQRFINLTIGNHDLCKNEKLNAVEIGFLEYN